jgi:Asp-tRNA(Asn)/Glu-tRNA(Gln) amidotransferase A subunit family amidase
MITTELLELTATEASDLIRKKEITSTELVSASIENAKKYQHLNAYITLDEAGSLERAKAIDEEISQGKTTGKLIGVPLAIKDNIEVAGLPNTAGTPALDDFIPKINAPVVQSLLNEGAIILGKTNMHELAFGVTSNNTHYGAVGNPYKPDYFAGGSSGGTGAAIARRMATAGLGSDTGGSVRIPAAINGTAGFRPTLHRYSQKNITPISSSRDTAGPMARSVDDLILIHSAILNIEPMSSGIAPELLRIGVPRRHFYSRLDSEVSSLMESTLVSLQDTGITLVEIDLPDISNLTAELDFITAMYEARIALQEYLQSSVQGKINLEQLVSEIASPDVKAIFNTFIIGDKAPAQSDYDVMISERLPEFKHIFRQYFMLNKLAAYVFPTVPVTARPILGSEESIQVNGVSASTFETITQNTAPGSIAGIPGICLPIGLSTNGLPISIGLDAPENHDSQLLGIGLLLEEILDEIPSPS